MKYFITSGQIKTMIDCADDLLIEREDPDGFDDCRVPICKVVGAETIRYEHDLEKRNRELDKNCFELGEKVIELESYIKDLTSERDNLSATAANLAEENLNLKGENKELIEDLSITRGKVDSLTAEIDKNNVEIANVISTKRKFAEWLRREKEKNMGLIKERDALLSERCRGTDKFYANIYISDDHVLEANQEFSGNVDGSLIEELSELTKALCKYARTHGGERCNIIEEIAHVLISLKMLCREYGINPSEIEEEIVKKNPKFYDLVTGYDYSSDKKYTVWSIAVEKPKK